MRSRCDGMLGRLIVAGALLGLLSAPAFGASLSVTELLEHGEQYHQQPVSVVGEAADVATQTGPRNRPFYTFVLKDRQGSVTVIMQGKPELSNGDAVMVHGVFIKSRKAGRSTITNRIEATVVRQLHGTKEPFVG
ncbi:MAG: hypothetical protein EPO02_02720 [Nitrospirae bacterium]|nr:MAG: hypothetical protein EPO02_02720 [Nitrospirota bacterium]